MYCCKAWSRHKKGPTELLTEPQAQTLHEARQSYTAVLGSRESPVCFVEMAETMIGVEFVDEQIRSYLAYTFSKVEPDKLFLTRATHRFFVDYSDKVKLGTTYLFKKDGHLTIRRQSFMPAKLERAEGATKVDGNYALWPCFGDYVDIAKKDRGTLIA